MAAAASAVQGIFLLVGVAILAGYLGHLLFKRYHVSDVLFLLLVGILAGPVLHLADAAILSGALTFLGPLGLAIILFEGGLELGWKDLRQHASKAIGMTLVTWSLTAAAIALVGHLVLGFSPGLAILFAVAMCATGILVVIPLLAQLNAPAEARVLLTIETSLGDLLSAVATTAMTGILLLGTSPASGAQALVAQFLVGGAVGFLAGVAWARILTAVKGNRFGYAVTLAVLMLAYVGAEVLGGSGFLAALAFGLVIGNAGALTRLGGLPRLSTLGADDRTHQSEFIFVLRSVYFVYLGLAVSSEAFTWPFLLAGLAFVAAMFVARVLAIQATAARGRPKGDPTGILLTFMMPRGLAAAVLAGIPVSMGVPGSEAFLTYAFLIIIGSDLVTSLGVLAYEHARRRAGRFPPEGAPTAGSQALSPPKPAGAEHAPLVAPRHEG